MNRVRFTMTAVLFAAAFGLAAGPAAASEFVKIQFNLSLSNPDGSRFDTVYLELFDDTPATQANFLNYVNDGDYDGVHMHRLVPGFVLQGGGYKWTAPPLPDGDLNGNGFVGLDDLDLILNNWNLNVPPGNASADVSGPGGVPDGFIGLDDLDVLLGNWNASAYEHIPTDGTVVNEFGRSNLDGTIAMAKLRPRVWPYPPEVT